MSTDVREAMEMLESLRVTDLRSLLSRMGRRKTGLKKDLITRVEGLLQDECSHELLSAVQEMHRLRWVDKDARRSSKPSHISPSSPEIISMPESISPSRPESLTPSTTEQQMIPLPFYQTLDTILPPTPLEPVCGGTLQNSEFLIHLSAAQQTQITDTRSSRSEPLAVQVVLRMCYSESVGVEEDQFPPNIRVSVNHTDCPVQCSYSSNKMGTEPSRPCRPVDITPLLFLSFTNRLSVTWANFGKRYSVGVYLVRLVSCQQLLIQLRSSADGLEVCRQRVCEKLRCDSETEIPTTGLQVSLICPIAKTRMSVACRGRGCAHLQCFDAFFYLQMNERKPRWSCPVCHRYAPFDALRVDGLQCEVLESCAEEVEEIEYLPDSSWRAVRPDRSNKNKDSVPHPPKHSKSLWIQISEGDSSLVDSGVVDLTLGSSDDEESPKEEMVSTHLEEKSVHFRKSSVIKTSGRKSRSRTFNPEVVLL